VSRRIFSVAGLLAAGALAAPAQAVHWSQAGGDGGRSGYQPLADGSPPVRSLWTTADREVVTSPLITAGTLEEQRVVYGTANGRVHLRALDDGERIGPEGGLPVEQTLEAGAFGEGGGFAFAETSGPSGLGVVLAVHNTRNTRGLFGGIDDDVAVARIDERTGELIDDTTIPGTADLRVQGPATLAPPDRDGDRALLFLAAPPSGAPVLFNIELPDGDRLGRVRRVDVPGVDARTGPAVAFLADGEPFAVLASTDGVRSYSLPRFPAEGPRSAALGGTPGTIAVPVSAGGLEPGRRGSGSAVTPDVYAASSDSGQTRVHRLGRTGNTLVARGSSPPLDGTAAPAVALAFEVIGGASGAGWIVVTTDRALHVLDARSLMLTGSVAGAFRRNVAAAAGRLAYVSQDGGLPEAVDLVRARALDTAAFPTGGARPSASAAGQPAVSRGIVVFVTDAGASAFRTRCANALNGSGRADELSGGVAGDAISGGDGADALSGAAGDDCLSGGRGSDRLSGGDGADTIGGGDGNDRVNGGAGDDVLRGDAGRDSISGGAGNDTIDAADGARDTMKCGPGHDAVVADRRDRVDRDCERVRRR